MADGATAPRNGSAPLRGNRHSPNALRPLRAHFNRSALMLAYNAALRLAREGKLDRARVNRGFALAQSSREIPYGATARYCGCKDASARKTTCKHQIACALRLEAGWKATVAA